jgi:hypothetical protein
MPPEISDKDADPDPYECVPIHFQRLIQDSTLILNKVNLNIFKYLLLRMRRNNC